MSTVLIQIMQKEWAWFCIIIHSQDYISEYLVKLTGAKVTSFDFQGREK